MNTTRRKFLGMLGAATAIGGTTALAFAGDTEFRDIESDKMYYFVGLNGKEYTDEEFFGKEWIPEITKLMRNFERWGCLDQFFQNAENDRLRLVPSQNEGGEIFMTEAWLREFWRRHNVI